MNERRHSKTRLPFLTALVGFLLIVMSPAAQAREDLVAREDLPGVTFRAGGDPRTYAGLAEGHQATYAFCGQGVLQVASRAVIPAGKDRARYTLLLGVDGAKPPRELDYRVDLKAGAEFTSAGSKAGAGALRRLSLDMARGCHTVELTLARSSIRNVGVRLSWRPAPDSRRRWDTVEVTDGASPVTVVVNDSRSAYYQVEPGEAAEMIVDGPAWVRVLARPVDAGEVSFALDVDRKGRNFRSYVLESTPSSRARLADRPGLELGRASEVVFAVGRGRQKLRLRTDSGSLLLRPQVAERDEGLTPDAARLGISDPGWSVRPRFASYYDDNILRYSDKFIQRFQNGQDPGRFRVDTLDDTIYRTDLYITRGFRGLGGRPAGIGVDVEHRAYQRNDIKDWSRFAVAWEQELSHDRQFDVQFSFMPDFYVRHLRDGDLTGGSSNDPFQAFEFEKSDGRFRFFQPLGSSIEARYTLGLATFRHNDAFREFDSENIYGGVRLDHHLTRRLRLSYGIEYTDSQARGYDEDGETLLTSDDTDPTYRQLDVMLAARIRLPGPRRPVLFFQAEAGTRDYTTNKPENLAPLHSGREDDLLRLYASLRLDLSSRYQLTVFAQSRTRSSTAPVVIDVGVEKDYDQFEAGLRLSARFGD